MGQFIAGLPECELHLHIEGTLEPEFKFELAARTRSAPPTGRSRGCGRPTTSRSPGCCVWAPPPAA